MNLKKITMHGFKSFADKTDIDFGNGITVIVGPNGCGKSNVVDAIKWVLGEQSAKSLRGGQMLDVIFNGSASRKSVGMAEVTLHFSNKSNKCSSVPAASRKVGGGICNKSRNALKRWILRRLQVSNKSNKCS